MTDPIRVRPYIYMDSQQPAIQPQLPPKKSEQEEAVEIEKSTGGSGLISTVVNWFWGLFYSEKKETEKSSGEIDRVESPDRRYKPRLDKPEHDDIREVNSHLNQSNIDIKNINEEGHDYTKKLYDPYALATEVGLEKAWYEALIRSISQKKDLATWDEQDKIRYVNAIRTVKEEIDKKLEARAKNGYKSKIFNILGWSSFSMILATTLVAGGIAVSLGTGNIPVALLILNGFASVAGGTAKVGSAFTKKTHEDLSADLFGAKDKRDAYHTKISALNEHSNTASDASLKDWKTLREAEDNKAQLVGVIHER